MNIVGWLIWGLACLILLTQVPSAFHHDGGVARLARRFCLFIIVGLIVTAFLDVSKLHLIWWIPATYFLNLALFSWSVNRKMGALLDSITPEVGKGIKWIDIVGQVCRVLEFDKDGTIIGSDNQVKATSSFKPYGYLLVESPIFNQPVRLPIVHRDDFLLASSVFDDPSVAETIEEDELLVTYVPKRTLPNGMMAGTSHALHYVITPRGTLDRYYEVDNDKHMTSPSPEKLFGKLVYDGEIRVQVNPNPTM
jgi:hypothetical protein